MEPKKITEKTLQKVVDELVKGSEDSRGTYLYKGFRLQISKYKASGAERTSRLYHKRREQGLCIRCGVKVKTINPKSGKLYRLCDTHRAMIDKKVNGSTGRKNATKATRKTSKKTARKTTRKKATPTNGRKKK